jgi:hypothetical protein
MLRLKALVKRVIVLCETRLKACHCIKEFTFRQINPLGRREKLALGLLIQPVTRLLVRS